MQRQRLPDSTSRTRSASQSGSSVSSACAVVIKPGVQKPHCRPWCLRNDFCSGVRSSSLRQALDRDELRRRPAPRASGRPAPPRRRAGPCRRRKRRARNRHGCRSAAAAWRRQSASVSRGSTSTSTGLPLTSKLHRHAAITPSKRPPRPGARARSWCRRASGGRPRSHGCRPADRPTPRPPRRPRDHRGVEAWPLSRPRPRAAASDGRRRRSRRHARCGALPPRPGRRTAPTRQREIAAPARKFLEAPAAAAGHAGRRTSVMISSGFSAVVSAPWKKSAAWMTRAPDLPKTEISASQVEAMPGISAAGSACARLPPTVPRLRI